AWKESQSRQEQRRLPEALSAARRAAGLVAGGEADPAVRQRAAVRVADLRLLERLENVRLEYAAAVKDEAGGGGHFNWELGDKLYREAFQEAGLEVEAWPAQEAGERSRGTTVAAELAAGLDDWATR